MTENKEARSSRFRIPIMVGFFGICSLSFMMSSRASVISDIPIQINNALLDGTSLYAAKAILTASIMMSAGLALALARLPLVGILLVLLSVLGALTAIGWADITFLIMAALLVMAMWGKTIVEWTQGGGTPGA